MAIGGHFVANADAREDFTWGIGPRVLLGIPLGGLALQGTYDFYAPECGTLECDLDEIGVDLLWFFPLGSRLSPFIGASVAHQKWEGQVYEGNESGTGANLSAGLVLRGRSFRRFKPFAGLSYQVWDEYPNQTVFTGGILLTVL